jgi:hypothetical protein
MSRHDMLSPIFLWAYHHKELFKTPQSSNFGLRTPFALSLSRQAGSLEVYPGSELGSGHT